MVALRLLSVLLLVSSGTAVEEKDFEYEPLGADYLDYPNYGVAPGEINHDYYSDYTAGVYREPDVSNATLRKCFCGLEESWNGTHCGPQLTYVPVLASLDAAVVESTSFWNVTVGNVTCPEGTVYVEWHPSNDTHGQTEHVALHESGHLAFGYFYIENYCIEHIYTATNHSNNWFAHMCVESPKVPRCCPTDHALDENGNCVASSHYSFLPPVNLGNRGPLEWPSVSDQTVKDITCNGSEETFLLEINVLAFLYHYQADEPPHIWVENPLLKVTQNYCVGVKLETTEKPVYVAKVCSQDPHKDHQEKCEGKFCIRKCCPEMKYFHGTCEPHNGSELDFLPSFYDPSNYEEVNQPKNLTFIYGSPLCEDFFLLDPHKVEDDNFKLLKNGYLYAESFDKVYPPTDYCIDLFLDEDHELRIKATLCFGEEDIESSVCKAVQTYLYPVLLSISIGFLVITLFVYIFVPELHAKVHGKCLLSHVSALLLAYISLFIVQRTTEILEPVACRFMASLTHFSFLATFFWLNVMCFDIWWTLKSMRPVPETGELSKLRFQLYSLYSWGCPLVIAFVSNIIEILPEDIKVIRPDFGQEKCWFKSNISLWAYFYGFVLVLVIANIIFFCQVAYILIVAQNDPILQRTRQQNRERMWLYVKLFLVMGITWITELISWQEGTCEAWILTDIINCLQGVSIFVIFICKRNLLKKVRSRWEPYLRHMKDVVGSKRLSRFSTTATTNRSTQREQLSFSSENRPNHSDASNRTVQSQLSFDPSSAARKISVDSLNATTGVQVHAQNSVPMDTIVESSSREGTLNRTPNGSLNSILKPNDSVALSECIINKETKGEEIKNKKENDDGKDVEDSHYQEESSVADKVLQDTEEVSGELNASISEEDKDDIRNDKEFSDKERKEDRAVTDNEVPDENIEDVDLSKNNDQSVVTINASTIPVYSPKENGPVEDSYVYSPPGDSLCVSGDYDTVHL